MRVMTNIIFRNKLVKFYMGLLGFSLILITTGCEVQKVGSTPSKDFAVLPTPGAPNPTDYTDNDSLAQEDYIEEVPTADETTLPTPPATTQITPEPLGDAPPPPSLPVVPPPPGAPALTPSTAPPPPAPLDPVSSEGTETVTAVTDASDPIAVEATTLLVSNPENASAVANIESAVENLIPGDATIDENAGPAEVAEVAQGFADAVQTSIEAGTGVPAVNQDEVESVLAQIDSNEVLSGLLAEFLGTGGLMGVQNNITPSDQGSLGRLLDYADCVQLCEDNTQECHANLDSTAGTDLMNCLAISQGNYNSCENPVLVNLGLCDSSSTATLVNCFADAATLYGECISPLVGIRNACADEFDAQKLACDALWGPVVSNCNEDVAANKAECDSLVLDAYNTHFGICEVEANTLGTTCDTQVSDAETVCTDSASFVLDAGLATASTAFQNLMNSVITMLNSPDPGTVTLGTTLESMGWTLYMNQCYIADQIYNYDTGVCADSVAIWNQACTDLEQANLNLCASDFEGGYDQCSDDYFAGDASCDSLETVEELACAQDYDNQQCQDAYDNDVVACDSLYTDDPATAPPAYEGEANSACWLTYTINDSTCQSYYDEGESFCFDNQESQNNFCTDDAAVDYSTCSSYSSDCVQTCHDAQAGG